MEDAYFGVASNSSVRRRTYLYATRYEAQLALYQMLGENYRLLGEWSTRIMGPIKIKRSCKEFTQSDAGKPVGLFLAKHEEWIDGELPYNRIFCDEEIEEAINELF